jgi:PKD repeat protein
MKTVHLFTFVGIVVLLQGCYKDPVANFDYSYPESMAPASVTFNNLSTEADKFQWDFGEGGTSNEKSPVYAFYDYDSPSVTLLAEGRGGDNSITKTVGITSFYVKNSLSIVLFNTWTFFWDGENFIDDFVLGTLYSGSDSKSVITNHDIIHVSFEMSDGTVYLTDPGFDLIVDGSSYIEIDGETTVRGGTGKKKGTMDRIDPGMILGTGEKLKLKDLLVQ